MDGTFDEESGGNSLHIDITAGDLDFLTPLNRAAVISMFPKKIQATRYSNRPLLPPLPPKLPLAVVLPNLPLFEAIQDYLFEYDKYTRIPINMGVRRFLQTHTDELENELTVGTYSATDKMTKVKYTNRVPYSPTDYAIAHLRLCELSSGHKLKPDYDKKRDIIPPSLHPVHYFSGPASGELAYIDLVSAYWQILWPTTIDMHFNWRTQEIEAEGSIPYIRCDEFAKQKEIRCVLDTLYNYRKVTTFNPKTKEFGTRLWRSPYYRPWNYAYILEIMHAIANDVKNHFHLLQWLTDAAVIPAYQVELVQEFLFEEWFLDSRLEATGFGQSNETNMYKVGDKKTGHFDPNVKGKPYSNLWNSNIETLKAERMARINGLPLSTPRPAKRKVYVITKPVCAYCGHLKSKHKQMTRNPLFYPCSACLCADYQYNSPNEPKIGISSKQDFVSKSTPAKMPKVSPKPKINKGGQWGRGKNFIPPENSTSAEEIAKTLLEKYKKPE